MGQTLLRSSNKDAEYGNINHYSANNKNVVNNNSGVTSKVKTRTSVKSHVTNNNNVTTYSNTLTRHQQQEEEELKLNYTPDIMQSSLLAIGTQYDFLNTHHWENSRHFASVSSQEACEVKKGKEHNIINNKSSTNEEKNVSFAYLPDHHHYEHQNSSKKTNSQHKVERRQENSKEKRQSPENYTSLFGINDHLSHENKTDKEEKNLYYYHNHTPSIATAESGKTNYRNTKTIKQSVNINDNYYNFTWSETENMENNKTKQPQETPVKQAELLQNTKQGFNVNKRTNESDKTMHVLPAIAKSTNERMNDRNNKDPINSLRTWENVNLKENKGSTTNRVKTSFPYAWNENVYATNKQTTKTENVKYSPILIHNTNNVTFKNNDNTNKIVNVNANHHTESNGVMVYNDNNTRTNTLPSSNNKSDKEEVSNKDNNTMYYDYTSLHTASKENNILSYAAQIESEREREETRMRIERIDKIMRGELPDDNNVNKSNIENAKLAKQKTRKRVNDCNTETTCIALQSHEEVLHSNNNAHDEVKVNKTPEEEQLQAIMSALFGKVTHKTDEPASISNNDINNNTKCKETESKMQDNNSRRQQEQEEELLYCLSFQKKLNNRSMSSNNGSSIYSENSNNIISIASIVKEGMQENNFNKNDVDDANGYEYEQKQEPHVEITNTTLIANNPTMTFTSTATTVTADKGDNASTMIAEFDHGDTSNHQFSHNDSIVSAYKCASFCNNNNNNSSKEGNVNRECQPRTSLKAHTSYLLPDLEHSYSSFALNDNDSHDKVSKGSNAKNNNEKNKTKIGNDAPTMDNKLNKNTVNKSNKNNYDKESNASKKVEDKYAALRSYAFPTDTNNQTKSYAQHNNKEHIDNVTIMDKGMEKIDAQRYSNKEKVTQNNKEQASNTMHYLSDDNSDNNKNENTTKVANNIECNLQPHEELVYMDVNNVIERNQRTSLEKKNTEGIRPCVPTSPVVTTTAAAQHSSPEFTEQESLDNYFDSDTTRKELEQDIKESKEVEITNTDLEKPKELTHTDEVDLANTNLLSTDNKYSFNNNVNCDIFTNNNVDKEKDKESITLCSSTLQPHPPSSSSSPSWLSRPGIAQADKNTLTLISTTPSENTKEALQDSSNTNPATSSGVVVAATRHNTNTTRPRRISNNMSTKPASSSFPQTQQPSQEEMNKKHEVSIQKEFNEISGGNTVNNKVDVNDEHKQMSNQTNCRNNSIRTDSNIYKNSNNDSVYNSRSKYNNDLNHSTVVEINKTNNDDEDNSISSIFPPPSALRRSRELPKKKWRQISSAFTMIARQAQHKNKINKNINDKSKEHKQTNDKINDYFSQTFNFAKGEVRNSTAIEQRETVAKRNINNKSRSVRKNNDVNSNRIDGKDNDINYFESDEFKLHREELEALEQQMQTQNVQNNNKHVYHNNDDDDDDDLQSNVNWAAHSMFKRQELLLASESSASRERSVPSEYLSPEEEEEKCQVVKEDSALPNFYYQDDDDDDHDGNTSHFNDSLNNRYNNTQRIQKSVVNYGSHAWLPNVNHNYRLNNNYNNNNVFNSTMGSVGNKSNANYPFSVVTDNLHCNSFNLPVDFSDGEDIAVDKSKQLSSHHLLEELEMEDSETDRSESDNDNDDEYLYSAINESRRATRCKRTSESNVDSENNENHVNINNEDINADVDHNNGRNMTDTDEVISWFAPISYNQNTAQDAVNVPWCNNNRLNYLRYHNQRLQNVNNLQLKAGVVEAVRPTVPQAPNTPFPPTSPAKYRQGIYTIPYYSAPNAHVIQQTMLPNNNFGNNNNNMFIHP